MPQISKIAICLSSFALCQCTSGRLHTAISNDTGRDVNLRASVRGGTTIEKQLEAGQTLSLNERIGSLSEIAFGDNAMRCELRNGQIERAVAGELYGRPRVILRSCG